MKSTIKQQLQRALAARSTANNAKCEAIYFAFGSNLHLTQMRGRCKTARPLRIARLRGYKLVFRGVADVVRTGKQDDCVYGALYEIRERDEAALDRYEGYPTLYGKQYARLADGTPIMFYTMVKGTSFSKRDRGVHAPCVSYACTIADGYDHWKLDTVHLDAALRCFGLSTAIMQQARIAEYDAYSYADVSYVRQVSRNMLDFGG